MLGKLAGLIAISALGTACSLNASITGALEQISETPSAITPPELIPSEVRASPDFLSGEVVTTSNGYKFKAVFGEIGNKQTLSNGYKVDGVFNAR